MKDFKEFKDKIFADINPAMSGTIYGDGWTFRSNAWQYKRGECRITRTGGGGLYLHGNTGSGMAGEHIDLIQWLGEQYNKDTPADIFKELASRYGVEWDNSNSESTKYRRARFAEVVWQKLVQAAESDTNKETPAVNYIKKRGFSPQNGAFGILTDESINEAKNALKKAFTGLSDTDIANELDALGIRRGNIDTRPIVLNLKTNGKSNGFAFRTVGDDSGSPKYINSTEINKGVYCDRLQQGKPVVIVEGAFDAIRLKSLGVDNVIALNGATVGDSLRDILEVYNINEVILWPDYEFDKEGKRIIDRTKGVLDSLVSTCNELEGWKITTVRVVDFETPEGVELSGSKIDPDSYGKDHPDTIQNKLYNAIYWYIWEFGNFEQKQAENLNNKTFNCNEAQNEAKGIYRRINDPFQRGFVKNYISKPETIDFYQSLGITPESLTDMDEIERNEAYKEGVKNLTDKLTKANQKGATPDEIGRIIGGLNELQARGTGAREEWDDQTGKTWSDELADYTTRPDNIKTKWGLGRVEINGAGVWKQYGNIEFWPSDITVFCAPTSHGKTMILFQSLIDMVQKDIESGVFRKHLFVSCEENHTQLFGRALNVFLPRDEKIILPNTRRAALRAYLRGECLQGYNFGQWDNLTTFLAPYIETFKNDILPRIDLIHTEATTEAISANIDYYTAKYRRKGVDIGAVYIDYLQLLTSDGGGKTARNYEIKSICKTLKDTAARGEVPYIMGAQLNRQALAEGLDTVSLSNIGEGADIERIAHDVYLLWQTDKTRRETYIKEGTGGKEKPTWQKGGRVSRMFRGDTFDLIEGCLYIERLKAREGVAGLWSLLPYYGESGQIAETQK